MPTPRPRIALFANRDSDQIALLRDRVEDAGGDPLVLDIQLGGDGEPGVAFRHDRACWQGVDFSDIHALHIRCAAVNTPAAVPAVLNAASYTELRAQFLREQEYQSVTYSFIEQQGAAGKLVVNPLTRGYIDHDSKIQFYLKLQAQGYAVPRSVMTNDPARALAFIQSVQTAVAKPSIGIGSTRVIGPADLDRLEELSACPVLFQERLTGYTVRVHIVGDRVVLALKIISPPEQVDSRTAPQGFELIRLSDAEEQTLVSANRWLGLHYAAWDLIVTPAGQHVYLDCNPGPYILWIGEAYSHAVLKQLAIYLVTYAQTRSIEAAASCVTPTHPN